MNVKAGTEVIDLLCLCYRANRPVLIEGAHGIGKSQLIEDAARKLGIECVVRDLSLMEPPDLVGLPTTKEGKTVYAPPSFLPTNGTGLLVFEELNRSEKYMMSPCLQLLTARCLNDYRLPDGWVPMAAVNPAEDGYQANELDAALLSRFVRIRVVPDVKSWLEWADGNGVHEGVCRYVGAVPDVFATTNPRAWSYASDLLTAHESNGSSERILLIALEGVVGSIHAAAFMKAYRTGNGSLTAEEVLRKYHRVKKTVMEWITAKRTDMLSSVAHNVLVALQSSDLCAEVSQKKTLTRNLEAFIQDLPGDLGRQVRSAAKSGGALS